MSKKTPEPHAALDLFSVAGLSEHALPDAGNAKCATQAASPACKPPEKTSPPIVTEEASNERYMRDTEVAQRYAISRQTVWRWAAQAALPEPIKLSEGATRWRVSDLLAHERSRPKGKLVRPRRVKSTKTGGQQ